MCAYHLQCVGSSLQIYKWVPSAPCQLLLGIRSALVLQTGHCGTARTTQTSPKTMGGPRHSMQRRPQQNCMPMTGQVQCCP